MLLLYHIVTKHLLSSLIHNLMDHQALNTLLRLFEYKMTNINIHRYLYIS